MNSSLHIGASKGSVEAARDSLLAIMESGRPDHVVLRAIEAFQCVTETNNSVVSGCVFHGSPEDTEEESE